MHNSTNSVCYIEVDVTKSIFANGIVYGNKSLSKTIEAINAHPCKVTRLFNGKINLDRLSTF
jgi:hypothetical protein